VKPSKYKNKPVEIDGIRFDSRKEAARWADLKILQMVGEIRNLQRQVPVVLIGQNGPLLTRSGRKMRLTFDFAYEDKRREWHITHEDCKGMPTRDYEVRKAVAVAMGLHVVES